MLTNARSPIILNRTKKETPNKSRRSHQLFIITRNFRRNYRISSENRGTRNPKFGIGIRNQRMKFLPRQEINE